MLNQKIHALSQETQQRQHAQAELARSNDALKQTLIDLQNALEAVQTEKMSGLGQLAAGIAHEINNPISFIHGNITYAGEYYNDLIRIIHFYQTEYPNPSKLIQQEIEKLDLDFIKEDIEIIKDYGELPWVDCSPGQINQVFMNLLNNAIDALEEAEKGRSSEQLQNHPSHI